jgi:hypothetical protein
VNTTPELPKPSPDAPPTGPVLIGRYRVLGLLGEGGMGTVHKALDPHLDRVVALKVPRFDGPADQVAGRLQRFQREARAAARVFHPHVCPIFDVSEFEGRPFVVMPFIEGESLAARLDRRGRCDDPVEALRLIDQVLDALGAVHDHGVIHRDLKPGNVLLDAAGRAILTDFGLARPTDDAERLTSDGAVVGTPAYMAPEQAAGQPDRIGPWTDLYSVGVLLYRMLTGRLPFEGPGLAVLAQIVNDRPPPPSSLRPDLDRALEAVLLRALARDPKERYQSAREFREALAACGPTASTATGVRAAFPADLSTTVRLDGGANTGTSPASPRRMIAKYVVFLVGLFFIGWGMLSLGIASSMAGSRGPPSSWYPLPLASGILCLLTGFPLLWALFRETTEGNRHVTRTTFARIKPGMTFGEVQELFGDVGETVGGTDEAKGRMSVRWSKCRRNVLSRRWFGERRCAIRVEFAGGRVIEKFAQSLFD